MSKKPQRSGEQAKDFDQRATRAARDLQLQDDKKVTGGTKVKVQDIPILHVYDKSSPNLGS